MDISPMQELIIHIGQLISKVFIDWLPMVVDSITENPVLILFVVAVPLVGIAVGIFNRLVRSN